MQLSKVQLFKAELWWRYRTKSVVVASRSGYLTPIPTYLSSRVHMLTHYGESSSYIVIATGGIFTSNRTAHVLYRGERTLLYLSE